MTVAWVLITFIPKFDNCPRGYLGPGGKHEHGKYQKVNLENEKFD
jgi:hypothetical protein